VMGVLLGLAFGLGCYLLWTARSGTPARRRSSGPGVSDRLAELIARAGVEAVTPARLVASSAGLAGVAFLLLLGIARSPTIALAFGVMAGDLPPALVRYRARQRQVELRELWPEVVDNITSEIRAGMSLPEALTQVRVRICDIATVEGWLVTQHRFYFDQMEFLGQLGLLPDLPS
jgi:tight adherence protein B